MKREPVYATKKDLALVKEDLAEVKHEVAELKTAQSAQTAKLDILISMAKTDRFVVGMCSLLAAIATAVITYYLRK